MPLILRILLEDDPTLFAVAALATPVIQNLLDPNNKYEVDVGRAA